MNINHPPRLIRRYYKDALWKVSENENILYLTFDDGPTPIITEKVLDILDEYQAKATFFCIARNVERHPEIFQEIISRGHSVGNHTYSHLKGWYVPLEDYMADVDMANDLIQSKLFRPPYGRIKKSQMKAAIDSGYKVIMWDVLTEDYNRRLSPEQCYRFVDKFATPGSIVVMHDSVKASANVLEILPAILKNYKEKGFLFHSLK